MKRTCHPLALGILIAAFAFGPASAAVITFNLDTEFSGGNDPAGTTPWATATIDDSFGGANTVRLTMSTANLVDQEFISEWYFNLDPALDPTQLTFVQISSDATVNSVTTGVNAFQADGDGQFDILFDFAPPPGDFASKFTTGETVVYDITYISALAASAFDFGSAPGGGNGTFRSAAHVQGIGTNAQGSGWIGDGEPVPEPMSLLLLGGGLLGIAGVLRGRKST